MRHPLKLLAYSNLWKLSKNCYKNNSVTYHTYMCIWYEYSKLTENQKQQWFSMSFSCSYIKLVDEWINNCRSAWVDRITKYVLSVQKLICVGGWLAGWIYIVYDSIFEIFTNFRLNFTIKKSVSYRNKWLTAIWKYAVKTLQLRFYVASVPLIL